MESEQTKKNTQLGCGIIVILFILFIVFTIITGKNDKSANTPDPIMKIDYTGMKLIFTNIDTVVYSDVNVEINDNYTFRIPALTPNIPVEIGVRAFSDEKGNRFQIDMVLKTIDIDLKHRGGKLGFIHKYSQ